MRSSGYAVCASSSCDTLTQGDLFYHNQRLRPTMHISFSAVISKRQLRDHPYATFKAVDLLKLRTQDFPNKVMKLLGNFKIVSLPNWAPETVL